MRRDQAIEIADNIASNVDAVKRGIFTADEEEIVVAMTRQLMDGFITVAPRYGIDAIALLNEAADRYAQGR